MWPRLLFPSEAKGCNGAGRQKDTKAMTLQTNDWTSNLVGSYYLSGNDNNLLSVAVASGQTSISYYWFNYH